MAQHDRHRDDRVILMPDEHQLSPEVYELLAAGRKVEAIKLIREETGLGLADAKELADFLSGYDAPSATPPPGMTEEGGAGGVIAIVIAILVAFLIYVFFLND
jgi:hypothetical protein